MTTTATQPSNKRKHDDELSLSSAGTKEFKPSPLTPSDQKTTVTSEHPIVSLEEDCLDSQSLNLSTKSDTVFTSSPYTDFCVHVATSKPTSSTSESQSYVTFYLSRQMIYGSLIIIIIILLFRCAVASVKRMDRFQRSQFHPCFGFHTV